MGFTRHSEGCYGGRQLASKTVVLPQGLVGKAVRRLRPKVRPVSASAYLGLPLPVVRPRRNDEAGLPGVDSGALVMGVRVHVLKRGTMRVICARSCWAA
jgi:hypothetical protein